MWRTLQARMQGCWDSCTVDVQQGSESPNHVKKHQGVSQCIGSPTVTCWASSHSAHHCDFEWFGFTCSNDQTAAEKRSVSGICSGPNMWLPYWRRWCKIVPWHRLSGFQILRQSHFWEGSKTSCVYLSIWRNLVQPWMPQFFPIVLWYFFPTFSWFIIFQLRIAINRGIPNFRQNQIIYSMLCICIYVCAEYILPRFMPSCGWETHFISRWLPVACTRNMDTTSLVCSLHSPPESYPLVN